MGKIHYNTMLPQSSAWITEDPFVPLNGFRALKVALYAVDKAAQHLAIREGTKAMKTTILLEMPGIKRSQVQTISALNILFYNVWANYFPHESLFQAWQKLKHL